MTPDVVHPCEELAATLFWTLVLDITVYGIDMLLEIVGIDGSSLALIAMLLPPAKLVTRSGGNCQMDSSFAKIEEHDLPATIVQLGCFVNRTGAGLG